MRARSILAVLTLVAFLPVATGCAATRTAWVHDDFVTDSTTAKLAAGDEVWITGYTTRSDGFRRWEGHVSVVCGLRRVVSTTSIFVRELHERRAFDALHFLQDGGETDPFSKLPPTAELYSVVRFG